MRYHTPSTPHRMLAASSGQHAGPKCMRTGSKMISWVQEIAGWAPIAYAWLVTAAVGTTIYFFPIARLLDSLADN